MRIPNAPPTNTPKAKLNILMLFPRQVLKSMLCFVQFFQVYGNALTYAAHISTRILPVLFFEP